MYYKITVTPHNHPSKHNPIICRAKSLADLGSVMSKIITKLRGSYGRTLSKIEDVREPIYGLNMYSEDGVLLITIRGEWVD